MDSLILCNAAPPLRTFKFFLLATAISLFAATPGTAYSQAVHQTISSSHVPAAVSAVHPLSRLDPSTSMQLSIVLPLRNQSGLTSLLSGLYDPSSPDYHHFLSVAQFTDQFSPTAEDYQTVVDFALANGFTIGAIPSNRMVVPIRGSAAQVEKAFNVKMNNYQHPTENRTFFSPDREPSLALNVSIAHITGLNNYSIPRSMISKPLSTQNHTSSVVTGSGPDGSYVSSDMRAAYYTSTLSAGSTALTGSGQTVGLVQFDGYNISDVVSTFNGTAQATTNGGNYVLSYTPVKGGTTYTIPINNVLLDGTTGAPTSGDDAEEVLDIVQAVGMAPGLSQVRVYIGSTDADILNAIASDSGNLAKQVSISWAWGPDDPTTDDVFFEEFAAQGQSVFAASGDYGAYSPNVPYYYPAEDAWVTAVGGTSLTTNGAGGALTSEVAWSQSGGGISPDGIAIPSWQTGVANNSNKASASLRNVPDVAMEADFDNYDCSMGNCETGYAGTSFAAPRWAGFMALVNQQAMTAGDSPAGFMNPWLYSAAASSEYGSDFHDVDAGNNGYEPGYEFYSVPGYDLVTGWGSPAGQNLINGMAPKSASAGFQLSTSVSSITLNPGGSGAATIGVIYQSGFSGTVNLSVTSSLPSGVTASFATNPTTASSVLTFTASVTTISGAYLVTVTGTSGAHSGTTYIMVNTPSNAVTITSPAASQVPVTAPMMKPGVSIPIQGTVVSGYNDLRLEWAVGINPASGWASSGMTLNGGSIASGANQTIGSWNTSSITSANYYTIRLSADYTGATVSATTLIYLEPDLISANWPKWLVATPASFSGIVPIVDGSGNTQLAIVEPTYPIESSPASYRVFSPDGSTDVSTSLDVGSSLTPAFGNLTAGDKGESLVAEAYDISVVGSNSVMNQFTSGGEEVEFVGSQVVLADLKGDSNLETLTLGYQPWNNLAFLYAWSPNGQMLNSKFPIQVPFQQEDVFGLNPGLVVGDINGDGSPEIIVQEASSASTFTLGLFANDGTALTWSAPTLPGGPDQMILADLDHNGKLEVILDAIDPNTGMYVLHVLQPDGTERSGWPLSLSYGEVYLAAGDLAGTGVPQIVVSSWDKLNVFNGNGTSFSNAWPITNSPFNPFGPVTLADIDGDGHPEILVANDNLIFPQGSNKSAAIQPTISRLRDGSRTAFYFQTNGVESSLTPDYFSPTLTAYHSNGAVVKTWQLQGMNGNQPIGSAQITVGDFNQDGKTEIAVETPLISGGTLDGWLVEGVMEVLATGATYNAAANVWPMLYHDTHNSATSKSATGVTAATPIFSLKSGSYTNTQSVTISDSTANATIYYTTNGSTPTASSTKYTGAIVVSASETMEAIAVASGYTNSAVASAAYTITKPKTTPTVTVTPSLSSITTTQAFTATIVVSSSTTPTGSVILTSGNYNSSTATLSGGSVIISIPAGSLAVGKDTLTASYTPDSSSSSTYNAATGTNSVTVTLPPSFTLSAATTTVSTPIGGSAATSKISVASENGFSSSVSFSATGLPTGVTASFSPTSSSTSSTVSLTAGATATPGSHSVTITGTSGSLTASTTITVTVPTPSFTLASSASALNVIKGSTSASVTISILNAANFSAPVTLAATGLPTGVTANFTAATTNTTSSVSFSASTSAIAGTYAVKVMGTVGGVTNSATINLTVPVPSFTLTASATTLSTPIGGSAATSKISVAAANGFAGSVSFTATGLPTGITANFSPTSSTSSSTLSLSAGATAAPGLHSVTIIGSFGSLAASTVITVSVPTPSFTLTSSSSALKVVEGSSASTTISILNAANFSAPVTLSASGLPTGITANFTAATNSTTNSVSFSASTSAIPGGYAVKITGTVGGVTNSTSINLTVPTPNFTLSAATASLSTPIGGSAATSKISVVEVNGFANTVGFTVSGLPTGVTANFSPASSASSSTMSLTAGTTATPGSHSVTITGTSGSLTASTTITVTVPMPSFNLASSASTLNVIRGSTSASATISILNAANFNAPVTLAAAGLPAGVTASFTSTTTSSTSSISFYASSSATPGGYAVKITGTVGGITNSTNINLTVPTPSFIISSASATLSAPIGGSAATSKISVAAANGFTGSVNFTATGLPNGITANFSPASSASSSTLSLTAGATATPGPHTVTITGTSGSLTASATVTVTVPTPSFTLTSSASTLNVIEGNSVSATISVLNAENFSAPVTLAATNLPTGVTATFTPATTNTTSSVNFSASSSATPGTYAVKITGVVGSITNSASIILTVPTPSFTLSCASNILSTPIGGSAAASKISVAAANGFNGTVSFTASGLPTGVTAYFSSISSTSYSMLTLTAGATATPGSHPITITGNSATVTASTTVTVIVPTPSFSLSLSPNSITVVRGASATSTIARVVNPLNFGIPVTLAVSGLPTGITAAFSATETNTTSDISFSANNSAKPGSYSASITGTAGGIVNGNAFSITIK